MSYPILLMILCAFLFLFSLVYFWLTKSDKKLVKLHSDYQKALSLQDENMAKEAGKKYYSSILFGLAAYDETEIETQIKEAINLA